MKTLVRLVSALSLLLLLALTSAPGASVHGSANTSTDQAQYNETPGSDQDSAASLDNLLVTITGLEAGDEATVTLLPEFASEGSELILGKTVTSKGTENIAIDMSYPLKDGYYQLDIIAPDEYFREPKAWLFMVSESKLINPQGKSVVFKLIPPDEQEFQPYRGSIEDNIQSSVGMSLPPPSQPPSIMMEWMLSLSSLIKEPITENTTRSGEYHYFGYRSSLDVPGIWSQFDVVDPGVRHGETQEFVVDRIYVSKWISKVQHWMEIGWAEHSGESNVRYMFEYDSTHADWRFYNLPGNPLQVSLYNFSGTTWTAMYLYNGNWYTAVSEDIGFSEADYQYNAGEVYTEYGDHPSLPSATTDISKLYISGDWENWDWQRWATTRQESTHTYDIHTSTVYYDFYIHEH